MIGRLLATAVVALGLVAPSPVLAQAGALTEGPVVHAAAGDLRGKDQGGVAVFRGVPYAKPPVGERRWRPAEPLPAWRSYSRSARSPRRTARAPAAPPSAG